MDLDRSVAQEGAPLVGHPGVGTLQAPFCDVCKHHHYPGVKCTICGHKGQSTLWLKMKDKAVAARRFTWQCFSSSTSTTGVIEQERGLSLVLEMRNRTCRPEYISAETGGLDFNPDIDHNARHLLAKIGDSYVSVARWRLESNICDVLHGQSFAIIDRLGVVPTHRKRGIARLTADAVINDISTTLKAGEFAGIIALVPTDEPQLVTLFTAHSFEDLGGEFGLTLPLGVVAMGQLRPA